MRGRLVVLVAAVAGVLAGCGGGAPGEPSGSDLVRRAAIERPVSPALDVAAANLPRATGRAETDRAAQAQGCRRGETRRMRSEATAYAALVKRRVVAYARPGEKRVEAFGRVNVNGYRTVFGVLSAVLDAKCRAAWYRVQLPIRPNGSTGYVRASSVRIAKVTTRIEIDVSKRRLDLYRRGRRTLSATVAVGAAISPTPPGSYYVNQRLVAPDPWGPFGPAALGISGFSPTLKNWVQGGPLAIHGTNDPSSIGRPVSYGCVRVPNDVVLRLFETVPAGTPVEIRA